jgi:uncharacterized protein (TIGR02145 family)
MKTIISSLKRTKHGWFSVSIAFITCLFFLSFSSCQKDDSSLLTQGSLTGMSAIAISSNTGILYYGHKIFTRSTGEPIVEIIELVNPDFEHFDDNFTLKIQNGKDKKTRVSSAEIWIDGIQVVGPSDYSKNVSVITKQIGRLTPESILEVKLKSAPGSSIDLWIDGTLKPGKAYIDKQGGAVISEDGNLILTIPQNTIENRTLFSVIETSEVTPKTIDAECIGLEYKLEPSGINFKTPIQITINYSNFLSSGVNPEKLGIIHWNDDGLFENISVNNNVILNELQFSLNVFSKITVADFTETMETSKLAIINFYWNIPVIKWYLGDLPNPPNGEPSYLTPQNISAALNAWESETCAFTFQRTVDEASANIVFKELYYLPQEGSEETCASFIPDVTNGLSCYEFGLDWNAPLEYNEQNKVRIFLFSGSIFGLNLGENDALSLAKKTLAHEIGHALGLGHSILNSSDNTIMCSIFNVPSFVGLLQWDIEALNKKYPCEGTVVDIDGNLYNTVTIGNQTWLKENLKTTRLNDGTIIPDGIEIPFEPENSGWGYWFVIDPNDPNNVQIVNRTTPAYCWFDDNINYKNIYGALYNWYTVNTGKLCPTGWHVPSHDELITLIVYAGGNFSSGKLKEAGTAHWLYSDETVTNETGFTALPGGYRMPSGSFYGASPIGTIAYWWTSTGFSSDRAWHYGMSATSSTIYRTGGYTQTGEAVRCIQDATDY